MTSRARCLAVKRAAAFLTAGLLAFLGSPSQARAAEVNVVKALLFTCPVCRTAESLDASIDAEARRLGGSLVHAPLPVKGDFSAYAYYALRGQGAKTASEVRLALYKGSQDRGLTFSSRLDVDVWLQSDLAESSLNLDALRGEVEDPAVTQAVARAYRLGIAAGVNHTPTYIVLRNNQIFASIDPTSVTPQNSLTAVRDAVVAKLREAAKD